jgi:hypothetical protein
VEHEEYSRRRDIPFKFPMNGRILGLNFRHLHMHIEVWLTVICSCINVYARYMTTQDPMLTTTREQRSLYHPVRDQSQRSMLVH